MRVVGIAAASAENIAGKGVGSRAVVQHFIFRSDDSDAEPSFPVKQNGVDRLCICPEKKGRARYRHHEYLCKFNGCRHRAEDRANLLIACGNDFIRGICVATPHRLTRSLASTPTSEISNILIRCYSCSTAPSRPTVLVVFPILCSFIQRVLEMQVGGAKSRTTSSRMLAKWSMLSPRSKILNCFIAT